MYIRFYPEDAIIEAHAEFLKHWHKMESTCTTPLLSRFWRLYRGTAWCYYTAAQVLFRHNTMVRAEALPQTRQAPQWRQDKANGDTAPQYWQSGQTHAATQYKTGV